MEIKSAEYNIDNGTIDVKLKDGKKISILCNELEGTLELTLPMQSRFDWLIYNEPITFAELVFKNKLIDYLKKYDKSYNSQRDNVYRQLLKGNSPEMARALAVEFMMYDS